MTVDEMRQVQIWVAKGGKLLIGRDHAGRQKVKVMHGPLHMFTHRYSADYEQIETLKQMLSMNHQSAA
jgi:hypothetical protein